MELPPIVDKQEWKAGHKALLAKEKEATRARDALAAERRRLPRLAFSTDSTFAGPDGVHTFLDLFESRRQLIVYHFWFPPEGEPCGGCTMFSDQVTDVAHLHARDTSFALVSTASQEQIDAYKRRLGWTMPWYTVSGDDFQRQLGTSEYFALNVFLRDGGDTFLTYETRSRGVEALGSVWTFLDLTPFGRQEAWEDSPAGYPQTEPYQWWRPHDAYEVQR